MKRLGFAASLFTGLVSMAWVTGCRGGDTSLMPLEEGRRWTYVVNSGFNNYVDEVQVRRRISAANTAGYELAGSLGVTRLAWVDHALLAENLINAQFVPPLPLLYDTGETHDRHWKGTIRFVERFAMATATQSQSSDDDQSYGGHKIHCIRSTVHLTVSSREDAKQHEIELVTWFSSGLGIIRQEQRTDGMQVSKLTLLEH